MKRVQIEKTKGSGVWSSCTSHAIHFQFTNYAGREAGKEIAREVVLTRLLEAGTGAGSSTCKAN